MSTVSLPPAGALALVVGGVRSGLSLARFLTGRGRRVRVCDLRPAEALGEFARSLPAGVETIFGGYDESVLNGCEAVYASPGVPWRAPLLEAARERGLIVSSDIDLFFQLSPAPIIGVTGTNGKTTTTALLGTV
ncbi:MAG: UDP-N-acetylmuramoyl-L-alanine--D-glutamate ligase, partial [Candidatus Dormibacteraeota bacterium]|nr:UDP-N-acetylmuramoyl-L-alanine--D-glutamate ligase [Candidatus Dormibacteraeota bacterium]